MFHLLCHTCGDHFFSGESDKEYVCPFCHTELEPSQTSLQADMAEDFSQSLA